MNIINKKITCGILVVLMIFGFCQGIIMHTIISSMGKKEIAALYKDERSKAEQALKNYVEIAYNIVEGNFENSQNKKWLQKEYGLQLNKIIDIAETIINEHIALVKTGKMSTQEAQQAVIHSLSKLRYNGDTGYIWINDVEQEFLNALTETNARNPIGEQKNERGMGYIWVNNMTKPYPTMLMHPTLPELDGKILNAERFNCALGIKKNLFVAMIDVVEKGGEGYVDYLWPKPTKGGLTEEKPKLSYVRRIPEWNWIIGTGIYTDDAIPKAIETSKQDLKKMRYDGGAGYFWINDREAPFPTMIMHPTMPELNNNVMDDDKFNVAMGEEKHLFKAFIAVTENDGNGFVNYMWPKPMGDGLSEDQPKLSFLRVFEPFNWMIGTGIYIDSIDRLVEEKSRTIKSTNFYLLLAILSVAVILFLFLTTESYYLIDRFFIRKINKANDDLQLEIEERKNTEKELIIAQENSEIANRAKSDFLANMSHEIRTPMNAVIGLDHLLSQTDLTAQQRDYLHKINLSADNLLNLIDDILDFSKIEVGKLDLEAIPFHLCCDVLQNASGMVGLNAANKELELMLNLDPDLPDNLIGDPIRLRQILINLLNNAVKFTKEGEVTLTVKKGELRDEHILVRFEVQDSGIGMSEEQLDRLFVAFSQADASTTRKFGGTGLGLTISKKLAEMMGGEIGATSVPGQGSTFWFTANLGISSEASHQEKPALRNAIKDLKVLVVDDNETARMILVRQLEQFGYTISTAKGGKEAIHLLQSAHHDTPFDLVLLDWMMPEMDGVETARQIKADIGLEKIPAIIMLTAYDKQKLMEEVHGLDLKAILVKPIFPATLFEAILTAFGKSVPQDVRDNNRKLSANVLGTRILLVEDNEINQQIAQEILEQSGAIVTVAENGEEGIEKLRAEYQNKKPFDVVLMDIQMPVMDGYTATKEIRKVPEFEDLPIIAMSANALVGDRKKALGAGMNDQVTKPINVSVLFNVLSKWVHRQGLDNSGTPVDPEQMITIEDQSPLQSDESEEFKRPTASQATDSDRTDWFDQEALVRRCIGNEPLVSMLIKKFISQTSGDLIDAERAVATCDLAKLLFLAHRIKGAASNLSMEKVREAADQLEAAAQKNDLPESLHCHKWLQSTFEETKILVEEMGFL